MDARTRKSLRGLLVAMLGAWLGLFLVVWAVLEVTG